MLRFPSSTEGALELDKRKYFFVVGLQQVELRLGLDGVDGSNPLQMRSREDFGAGETCFNWLGAVESRCGAVV